MKLPPLAALLAADGDERIMLGSDLRNRYGRSVIPTAELAFGSSTASSISQEAWRKLERIHDAWQTSEASVDEIFCDGAEAVRARFSALYKLERTSMILAPSGTDAHLFAALLLAGPHDAPLLSIGVEASETGRGAPLALAARRFGGDGAVLSFGDRAESVCVANRRPDGALRAQNEVMEEIDRHIQEAASHGRRALLVATDVSKTGLIAPSPQTVRALSDKWRDRLDVLIDACQLRLSPASLRAWLDQGYMVAVSGSKFAGGPAFSGMLLIPEAMDQRLRRRSLPRLAELGHFAQWPSGWAARQACSGPAPLGVLARWEAALHEMETFFALGDARIGMTMMRLCAEFSDRLATSKALTPRASPRLERAGRSWDQDCGIFLFTPATSYGHLRGLQIGQPVRVGHEEALRLCISMPMITRASRNEAAMLEVIDDLAEAIRMLEAASAPLAPEQYDGYRA